MRILDRSNLLPHYSYVLHNDSRYTHKLRLSDKKIAYTGETAEYRDCEYRRRGMCSKVVQPSDSYAVTFTGDADKEYLMEPGKEIVIIFEGGLVPPNDFEEDLILAVYKPDYNFCVPQITTQINFECAKVTAEDCALTWEEDIHLQILIHSKYAKQRVPCTMEYKVTVTEDELELNRCCLIHVPKYHQHQDELWYFPHKGVVFGNNYGKICECCV
jgi:hypothetical protein